MTASDFPEFALTDGGLIFQGGHIDYDAIEAITFKLLPLLQNRLSRAFYGIDTSVPLDGSSLETPKFALHLTGGTTLWVSRGWDLAIPKSRVEAIYVVADVLHQRTFDRRFERYRTEFESEDRFSYGRYQFCRNGDILKSARRLYNVRDKRFSIVLGRYHVYLERKATVLDKVQSLLGQLGDTIDISRDRDCFLSMYRLAYGTYWTDEQYQDDANSEQRE